MSSPNIPSAISYLNSNSSYDISKNQEGQSQTLSDISELQNIELEYFTELNKGLTNNTLSQSEKDYLMQKINEISQMRINLYKNLNGIYNFYNENIASTNNTMSEQSVAIQIVENELNEAKRRLSLIEEEKNNKFRLVEINNYYSQKYNDHSNIMKIIIVTCVLILIISFLKNRGLLPGSVYGILFIIIGSIGIIVLCKHLLDSSMRDNMYYDEKRLLASKEDIKNYGFLEQDIIYECIKVTK
jgi:hypothetical protein